MNKNTKQWLIYGQNDLKIAYYLLEKNEFDNSLYHLSQSIEKHIKSFFVDIGIPFKKTHDFLFLLKDLKHNGIEVPQEVILSSQIFSGFARQDYLRYPLDDNYELDLDDFININSSQSYKIAFDQSITMLDFVYVNLEIDQKLVEKYKENMTAIANILQINNDKTQDLSMQG